MIRRLLLALAGAAGLVSTTAACQPVPGLNAVAGDSITVLSRYDTKDTPGSFLNAGSTEVGAESGHKAVDLEPWVRGIVKDPARSPICLIVEFGENEAMDGVIDGRESDGIMAMVFDPDPTTRVVLVKPHRVGGSPAQLAAVEKWRGMLDTLTATRPGTIELDLEPILGTPGNVADDGLHPTADGAEAIDDLYREGCS